MNAIGNNAEFAQVADVSMISKNGTNLFHGSAFYNYNGSFLNANPNYFDKTLVPSRSVNNDFGASLGGPIFRDRTFFFGTFEGLRSHSFASQIASVLPNAFRQGDFSSLLAGSSPVQLMNPFTGNPFPGNVIPQSMINPVSKVLLDKYFPAPNVPGGNQFVFARPATNDSNQYDIRVDHNFSDRHRLFARWSAKYLTPVGPVQFPALGDSSVVNRPHDLVISYNYTITPNLLNEFRFGWAQSNQLVKPIGIDHKQALADLGLKLTATQFPEGVGFPHIFIDRFDPINFGREEDLKERNLQYADNVSWTLGRHALKFGGVIHQFKVNEQATFNGADNLGEFFFHDVIPNRQNPQLDAGTGYAAANFLLGLPSMIDQDSAGPDWEGVAHQYGFFAQDSWKVSDRLTLNFGLRYEYHPPFRENFGNITNFDRTSKNGDAWVPDEASLKLAAPTFVRALHDARLLTAAQAGVPKSLRFADKTDFNPRISFAWLPFSQSTRTVLRGSYGIYTIRVLGAVFNSLTAIHSASAVNYFPTVDTVSHTPTIVWPNTTDSSVDFGVSPLQGFYTANDPHFRDPRSQQWSFTVEHQFSSSATLRATYSGQHATGLAINPNLNQIPFNKTGPTGPEGPPANRPFKSWDYLSSRDNGGSNRYNDLTVQFKVTARSLLVNSTYVLAQALTNAEGSIGDQNFTSEVGDTPSDRFQRNLDWGNQLGIPRQRWVTIFDYTSPLGKGKTLGQNLPAAIQAIAGDWHLFTITTLQTGHFLTAYTTTWNPSGIESPPPTRVDLVNGQDPNSGPRTVNQWFNTKAFSTAAFHDGPNPLFLARIGTSPLGNVGGPGFFSMDLALRRNFHLGERMTLGFLAQAKNALNHANLSDPNMNTDDPNFGRIFGLRQNSARTVILGARLEF